jgi:hypothetical protein
MSQPNPNQKLISMLSVAEALIETLRAQVSCIYEELGAVGPNAEAPAAEAAEPKMIEYETLDGTFRIPA